MIEGNVIGLLQRQYPSGLNDIGERVMSWINVSRLKGYLDYSGGEANRVNYDAKIQESTHVFICQYQRIDASVTADNSRMVINGKTYDVKLIDDPMELHKHLEIYLQYTGD